MIYEEYFLGQLIIIYEGATISDSAESAIKNLKLE